MDVLKKKKRFIKLNLTRIKSCIGNLTAQRQLDIENLSKLEVFINEYQDLYNQFQLIAEQILNQTPDDDPELAQRESNIMSELSETDVFLCNSKAKVNVFTNLIMGERSRDSLVTGDLLNQSIRETTTNKPNLKLDKIRLPMFDGNILKFQGFKGMFENLVHYNEQYKPVEKLHLLKSAMVDDAKELLTHFEMTDPSYALAWNYLLNRYENKRVVVKTLFRKLCDIEPIKSESKLRALVDEVDIIVRGLIAVGEKIDDTFSKYLVYHVCQRLDSITRKDFENSLPSSKTYPIYEVLHQFLQARAFAAEDRADDHRINMKQNKETKFLDKRPTSDKKVLVTQSTKNDTSNSNANTFKIKCVLCQDNHFLNQCHVFNNKNVLDRCEVVKQFRLCWICLSPKHNAKDCKRSFCSKCNGKHNVLLHRDNASDYKAESKLNNQNAVGVSSNESKIVHVSQLGSPKKVVILGTAVVKIVTGNGKRVILARVLLDPASETTLVTKSFVKRAEIQVEPAEEINSLHGITDGIEVLDTCVTLIIQSRFSDYQIAITADVTNKLPYNVRSNVLFKVQETVNNLNFAECDLAYTGCDILLGAEYYEFVLERDVYFVDGVALRNTKFGYVVSGSQKCCFSTIKGKYCGLSLVDIDSQLQKFWNIEDNVNELKSMENSMEYDVIESIFNNCYYRDETGRFVVPLPAKSTISELSGSFGKATSMLLKSERRRKGSIINVYKEFMLEYENLGHMRKLDANEITINSYYIPHHLVQKPTSTTTKYRVVFNASSVDLSGKSLNDHLLAGPVLQPELFDTIIRFRRHRIAICADINKMYRQVLIRPIDRQYQRIVWRDDLNKKVDHYELNTVTYGTKPASYLATKCLQVLANECCNDPEAANVIKSDFYMDDWISGAESVESAIKLQQVVHTTLLSGGFPLRKYQSNCPEFLQTLDPVLVETMENRSFGSESFVHLLGLMWYPKSDCFRVALNLENLTSNVTKRVMLSEISKIFDVLGMLSPIVIRFKILLQDVWREELQWDQVVSEELKSRFLKGRAELTELKSFSILRPLGKLNDVISTKLIGFCDASSKAYCAVVYLLTTSISGISEVSFVCSKSRVTPTKSLTIPRCELLAAVLLSQLLKRISTDLNVAPENIFAFSDSSIVLCWLKCPLEKLKLFVANRVGKIINVNFICKWHYIPSKLNPADLGTRGISVQQFLNSFWLTGPSCLKNDFNNLIKTKFDASCDIPDLKKEKQVFNVILDSSFFNKFSSFNKLVNVTCYILRLFTKVKPNNVMLTVIERNNAISKLIFISQHFWFSQAISKLSSGKPLKKTNCLLNLNPFMDDNGILRVGGRFINSHFAFDERHPVILSSKCKFVYLFVKFVHEKFFHCNKSIIKMYITKTYWIVGGLINLIKKCIRSCILCQRLRADTGKQLMGSLPAERVAITRPFVNTGIDFTGHINLKCTNHRSTKHWKAYIAIFVCFSTRAVHLEIVPDLTTLEFLNALRRFISRRGRPSKIFSDNGKNFVGAQNEFYKNRSDLVQWSTSEGIAWTFIAPRSPHQGGLWEAAVKSAKSLMVKAIMSRVLNYVELETICCQIEAILNSRPIASKSDESIITPGHFLIGDNLLSLPLDDAVTADVSPEKRFTIVQSVIKSFWKDWRYSYLNELQRRVKWQKPHRNLMIGDVVLLKEENVPVLQWPMGRISKLFPGSDGWVRTVSVKTTSGEFVRSVQKLVLLLPSNSE